MDDRPIGVMDSGVGGLTVWRKITQLLPFESTLYIGDSKNAPYGARKTEEILSLASRMIEFLLKQNVKLIVIACNTITVSGIDRLRKKFPQVPIVGAVPVIKTAVSKTKTGKIGVLSTTKTAESEYQKSLLHEYARERVVVNRGTNMLVPLIEKGDTYSTELQEILQKELAPFTKKGIDVLALGCTHFPFISPNIKKILGDNVMLLDSSDAIARQVERILEHNHIGSVQHQPIHTLYTTGDNKTFSKLLRKIGWKGVGLRIDLGLSGTM